MPIALSRSKSALSLRQHLLRVARRPDQGRQRMKARYQYEELTEHHGALFHHCPVYRAGIIGLSLGLLAPQAQPNSEPLPRCAPKVMGRLTIASAMRRFILARWSTNGTVVTTSSSGLCSGPIPVAADTEPWHADVHRTAQRSDPTARRRPGPPSEGLHR
jgi:hypothetical protein